MRILHFSDVHIGVENYGLIDPNSGMNTRLTDFLSTFDQVVEYAIGSDVDLVLFAGDAYKSRDPSQTHQREFAKRIARLSNAGLPVFLLVGNHDLPQMANKATALDIFQTLTVPNITVGNRLDTYRVETRKGPIQIIALPWIRRSAFLAREETRDLTIDQIGVELQNRVSRILTWHADSVDPDIPTILVAHASLNTAQTSSEKSMLLGRDPIIMQSSLSHPNIDYVALGHIHKHQVLTRRPMMVYSGSLERIDFGEENDEKGFCLIDIDPTQVCGNRLANFMFKKVEARRFVTIRVDVPSATDPTDEVLRKISQSDVSGSIVRVTVEMSQEAAVYLREDAVRSALSEAQFITPIVRNIKHDRRARLGSTHTEGISPLKALNLYIDSANVSKQRADILRHYGEILINEQIGDV